MVEGHMSLTQFIESMGGRRGEEARLGFNLLLITIFCASLFLNFFLLFSYSIFSLWPELRWSLSAAAEAEAISDISCSGHGRAFVDGVAGVDGMPSCECNTCYHGSDCSLLYPDCSADADSGNPMFLEPYWLQSAHAKDSAVVVAGWHRMSYTITGENFVSVELERHILMLHRMVGNAVVDDRFIVFGTGSTQLLYALVHALSLPNSSSPASVVASIPYYPPYRMQVDFFDSKLAEWRGVTSSWINESSSSSSSSSSSMNNFIEFVTSPNNPDGLLKDSILSNSSTIYDHAYYWPHFTAIPAPSDQNVMVFSSSKLSGHAGSRFGWALIKDEQVYKKVIDFMKWNTMGVSRDTQLRMLKISSKQYLQNKDGKVTSFHLDTKQ